VTAPSATGPRTLAAPDEKVEPSPFHSPRFVIFAIGNSVNNVGEAVYATALPLLVYGLTGSLGAMSLVAAAVPLGALLAPSFGIIADRWDARVLVVSGLLVQAVAALAMNLFLVLRGGHVGSPALFVCALALAVGGTAYRIGWMTGIPRMFPDCPVRARGTLNSLFFTTVLIGPVIVAASLSRIGYTGLLWANMVTFFAPIAVTAIGIYPPRSSPRKDTPRDRDAKLAEGWRAIVSDRRLLAMLVVQCVMAIACGAGLNALIVYDLLHSWNFTGQQTSATLAIMNGCMLAGNLLVAQRKRLRPPVPLSLGMAAATISLLVFAVHVRPLFLVALTLVALGQGLVLSTIVMARIKYLPAAVLGRASGLLWLITGGAALLSPVITPALSGALGPRGAFAVLGVVSLAGLAYLTYCLRQSRGDWATAGGGGPPQTTTPGTTAGSNARSCR
jgi:MFS family permease